VCFRNTSGLVLTSVFQYFYFILKKYWANSDTFYLYLSSFFSKYFYVYLSKKNPQLLVLLLKYWTLLLLTALITNVVKECCIQFLILHCLAFVIPRYKGWPHHGLSSSSDFCFVSVSLFSLVQTWSNCSLCCYLTLRLHIWHHRI